MVLILIGLSNSINLSSEKEHGPQLITSYSLLRSENGEGLKTNFGLYKTFVFWIGSFIVFYTTVINTFLILVLHLAHQDEFDCFVI